MRLKVRGHELLYANYVHSALVPTFHRRSYWLLEVCCVTYISSRQALASLASRYRAGALLARSARTERYRSDVRQSVECKRQYGATVFVVEQRRHRYTQRAHCRLSARTGTNVACERGS